MGTRSLLAGLFALGLALCTGCAPLAEHGRDWDRNAPGQRDVSPLGPPGQAGPDGEVHPALMVLGTLMYYGATGRYPDGGSYEERLLRGEPVDQEARAHAVREGRAWR